MSRDVVAARLGKLPPKWRKANVQTIDRNNVGIRHGDAECRSALDLSKVDLDRHKFFGRRLKFILRRDEGYFGGAGVTRSPQQPVRRGRCTSQRIRCRTTAQIVEKEEGRDDIAGAVGRGCKQRGADEIPPARIRSDDVEAV